MNSNAVQASLSSDNPKDGPNDDSTVIDPATQALVTAAVEKAELRLNYRILLLEKDFCRRFSAIASPCGPTYVPTQPEVEERAGRLYNYKLALKYCKEITRAAAPISTNIEFSISNPGDKQQSIKLYGLNFGNNAVHMTDYRVEIQVRQPYSTIFKPAEVKLDDRNEEMPSFVAFSEPITLELNHKYRINISSIEYRDSSVNMHFYNYAMPAGHKSFVEYIKVEPLNSPGDVIFISELALKVKSKGRSSHL